MRCVSDWSIRRQLILAFVGVLIPYFFLGAFATSGLWRVLKSLSEVHTEAVVEFGMISRLELAVNQIHESVGRYRASPYLAARAAVERDLALFQTARDRLEGVTFHDPEEREGLARILTASPVIENNVRQLLLPKNPGASARQEEALAQVKQAQGPAADLRLLQANPGRPGLLDLGRRVPTRAHRRGVQPRDLPAVSGAPLPVVQGAAVMTREDVHVG